MFPCSCLSPQKNTPSLSHNNKPTYLLQISCILKVVCIILFYLTSILLPFSFISSFLYAAFKCFRNRFAAPSKMVHFSPSFPVLKSLATSFNLHYSPSILPAPISFFLPSKTSFHFTSARASSKFSLCNALQRRSITHSCVACSKDFSAKSTKCKIMYVYTIYL
jgi:hypothetical protein